MPHPPEPTENAAPYAEQASMMSAFERQEIAFNRFIQHHSNCYGELKLEMQRLFAILDKVLTQKTAAMPLDTRKGDAAPTMFTVQDRCFNHEGHASGTPVQAQGNASCLDLGQVAHVQIPAGQATSQHATSERGHKFPRHAKEEGASTALHLLCSQTGFVHQYKKSFKHTVNRSRTFVTSIYFEMMMSAVILMNLLVLGFQLQCQGLDVHARFVDLDGGGAHSTWSDWKSFFTLVEMLFVALYMFELLLRIFAFKRRFFFDFFNVADASIILANFVEVFFLSGLQSRNSHIKLSALRVFRSLKIFRFAKLVKYLTYAKEIQLFVRTVLNSIYVATWCIIMIWIVIAAAAIFMVQICIELMDDDGMAISRRKWLFESFGTTSRGLFTMFEASFTGHWWYYAGYMTQKLRWTFALFWIPFVLVVNFLVMRVVTAIFLKQTLALADLDKEKAAYDKMKQKAQYAKEIRSIFAEADLSRDGLLSKAEWDAMLENHEVITHFQRMGLDSEEVDAVFHVCAADDQAVDFEEFLHCAMKIKGSARTIDMIQVMHKQLAMSRQLTELKTMISKVGMVLNPNIENCDPCYSAPPSEVHE